MGVHFIPTNTAAIIQAGPAYGTDGLTPATTLTITDERISLSAETYAGSAPTYVLNNVTGAMSGTSNDLNYITSGVNAMFQLELSAANNNRLGFGRMTITSNITAHVPIWEDIVWMPLAIWNWFFNASGIPPVNATQLSGQTVTAAAGVTFPSSVASPTNITAGTITTTVNLTNAPTVGDLTAAMKTSVTTAATAATPIAASVAGNIGGLATGAKTDVENATWNALAASHTGAGTMGLVLSSVATGAAPSAATVAAAVWDLTGSGHSGAGTFGGIVQSIATGSAPSAATVAAAVWNETGSAHVTAGTFGKYVQDTTTKTGYLPSATAGADGGVFIAGANAATTVNFTGNLSGSVGSVAGNVAGSTNSVVETVNADVTEVNSVPIGGAGTLLNPWGPA